MVDYEKQFERPDYATGQRHLLQMRIATTFKIVYGWMCAGLALTGLVAWYTVESGLYKTVLSGPGFMICIVAELVVVLVLSFAIGKMPVALGYLMFIFYAALNGLTLSVVFLAYDLALVQRVFFITAGKFGGLALWGTFTKGDLSSIGSVCGMALWGLIIGLVVNLFLKSSGLDWILTFAGIIIFTGLTMYDAQKIKQMALVDDSLGSSALHRAGIMGALTLYLDFINLFLYLLRFFGRKR